jgi:hypothetical protein
VGILLAEIIASSALHSADSDPMSGVDIGMICESLATD